MHVIVPYMYINETGSVLQNQELQKQMNLVVNSKLWWDESVKTASFNIEDAVDVKVLRTGILRL